MKKNKEFMITATIYKTTYIEATSEQEAIKKAEKELYNELDDTYNIAEIELADNGCFDPENLNDVKAGFYTNYDELDKGFSHETINELDYCFSTIDTLGSDITDIEKEEGNN